MIRPSRVRLWVVSLVMFAAGFAGSVAARALVGNIAWSYPVEVHIQWYAYLGGLVVWLAWLVMQAQGRRLAAGCMVGMLLAVASFFAMLSSIPK